MSRLSQQLRCPFSKCRDRESWSRVLIESLDWDKDKNWDKSRLYSIDFVEICHDVIFQTVKNFSTVKMSFSKVLKKSWLSRLTFSKCRDKSRPPGLILCFHSIFSVPPVSLDGPLDFPNIHFIDESDPDDDDDDNNLVITNTSNILVGKSKIII